MAGRVSSKHHQRTGVNEPVYNVRVSYPVNENSSKKIRDNLLIDFFGYNEADIKSFNEQRNYCYFIIGDPLKPDQWATGAQVNSWTLNNNPTVPIRIPQKLIDDLNSFRRQRASFEAFKVGMFVSDAAIRKHITDDLENYFFIVGRTANRRARARSGLAQHY